MARCLSSGERRGDGTGRCSWVRLLGDEIPQCIPGRLQLCLRQEPSLRTELGAYVEQWRVRSSFYCGIPDLWSQRLPHGNLQRLEKQCSPLCRHGSDLPGNSECHGEAERTRIDSLLWRLPRPDLAVFRLEEHLRRKTHGLTRIRRRYFLSGVPFHSEDRYPGQRELHDVSTEGIPVAMEP